MQNRLKECPQDAVTKNLRIHLQGAHGLASLKTRKVQLHSCEPFNWDHRNTDMRLSWRVFVDSIFIDLVFVIMITYFFSG